MSPIQIKDLGLIFPHKICFESFHCSVPYGSRIGIIGRNGSGKSTLLAMFCGDKKLGDGQIIVPETMRIALVPQVIDDFENKSGGQRFQASLTQALNQSPDLLLLDEPTNHLDARNRQSLLRLLNSFTGTLLVVSHDESLLCTCVDTFWQLENNQIQVFHGTYDDVQRTINQQHLKLEKQLCGLARQNKANHQKLMQAQQRAAGSRAQGQKAAKNKKWAPIVAQKNARQAEQSAGKKQLELTRTKQELTEQRARLYQPEAITPKFFLPAGSGGQRTLVSIVDGTIAYNEIQILQQLNLSVFSGERIALSGDNGSGKTSLIQAILAMANPDNKSPDTLQIFGQWQIVDRKHIACLDQHYRTLNKQQNALETIQAVRPQWSHLQIRAHLNDFLFRKNEEVNTAVAHLSGGEKARLSLAQIAAQTPELLILDELSNNLDLETKNHVIGVLQHYPGALIAISHEASFLQDINIQTYYTLKQQMFSALFLAPPDG